MSTDFAKLKARCRELVDQGLHSGPCSGKGVTREKLETIILDRDGVLPAGVVVKYSGRQAALPLPSELLYNEILPQLSIGEIYRYCSTHRETTSICKDVYFWKDYLVDYNHEEIQEAFINAVKHNNLAFVRLLIENDHLLDLVIDERSLRKAYYLFAQRHNSIALIFLSRQTQYRKIRGLISQEEFDRLERMLNEVANSLRDIKSYINKYDSISLILPNLRPIWREILNTGLYYSYSYDRLFELLGADIFHLLILRAIDLRDGEDDDYIVSEIVKELFDRYIANVSIDTLDDLKEVLGAPSEPNNSTKLFLSSIITEKASYDVYLTLEPFLSDVFKSSTSDRRLWYQFYENDQAGLGEQESLIENAYLAISPSEWYTKLNDFSDEQRAGIIRVTLAFSNNDGYTAWHDEAKRLVNE